MQAWNLTGDVYSTHPGDKPWISEMYGYSFGAAKANVWHRYHTTAMIYPGYLPIGTSQGRRLQPAWLADASRPAVNHNVALVVPGMCMMCDSPWDAEPPKVLHYGLLWEFEVGGRKYGFDKVLFLLF